MSEWRQVELGQIADVRVSNVDKKTVAGEIPVQLCNYMDVYSNDYIRDQLDFMQASASIAEIARFKVERGDVLITKDSETPDDIGIPSVVIHAIDNLVCGYHVALIKPNKSLVDSVYLSKQLGRAEMAAYFARYAAGSTRYGLPMGAMNRAPIALPPLPQQRKIAAIFSTIDTAIEQTEALIEKYQYIKAGLMHDLFTRGVLPNGQLRPPREQAPDLYQETAIGWIPREWEVGQIGNHFEIQLGKMLNQLAKTGKNSFPYLGNRSVQWNRLDLDHLDSMDFNPEEQRKFALKEGDLLVCEGGEVGRTAIWESKMESCFYQKAIHRLRIKHENIKPRFMLWYMHFAQANGQFADFTSQSSIAHLTQEKLAMVPVLLPSAEEQALIVSRIDAHEAVLDGQRNYLVHLRAQKRGLMQEILTGKVSVKVEPEALEAAGG
jgi:type I restriction enzyme S subunit